MLHLCNTRVHREFTSGVSSHWLLRVRKIILCAAPCLTLVAIRLIVLLRFFYLVRAAWCVGRRSVRLWSVFWFRIVVIRWIWARLRSLCGNLFLFFLRRVTESRSCWAAIHTCALPTRALPTRALERVEGGVSPRVSVSMVIHFFQRGCPQDSGAAIILRDVQSVAHDRDIDRVIWLLQLQLDAEFSSHLLVVWLTFIILLLLLLLHAWEFDHFLSVEFGTAWLGWLEHFYWLINGLWRLVRLYWKFKLIIRLGLYQFDLDAWCYLSLMRATIFLGKNRILDF